MGDIVELFVNQGVAVAMCVSFVALVFFMFKSQKEDFETQRQENKEQIAELKQSMDKQHEEDYNTIRQLSGIVAENSKALLKNSEAMERIAEKVDGINERVQEVQKDVQEIKYKQAIRDNNK